MEDEAESCYINLQNNCALIYSSRAGENINKAAHQQTSQVSVEASNEKMKARTKNTPQRNSLHNRSMETLLHTHEEQKVKMWHQKKEQLA